MTQDQINKAADHIKEMRSLGHHDATITHGLRESNVSEAAIVAAFERVKEEG